MLIIPFVCEHFHSSGFFFGGVKGKKRVFRSFGCHCEKATVESVFNNFNKKHFPGTFLSAPPLEQWTQKTFSSASVLCDFDIFFWCNLPAYHFWLNKIKNERAKCTQISIIIGYGSKVSPFTIAARKKN